MKLTPTAIAIITRKSANRFKAASLDPMKTQQQMLLSLVQANKDTAYGKRYNFASVAGIADYQRQVPVVTYDDLREDMGRVLNGESNIFTAQDPSMFAQTSGTTGEPKFIPVIPTDAGRDHKDIMRTWIYHSYADHPSIFDGKIVSLVSPAVEGHAPSGVPYGSTSGHMYQNMPGIIRRAYSVPYRVFEIADYTAKYYAIMRTAMEQDVTLLCTANPSSILKMCEKGNEFAESIIRDIRDGTLSREFAIEGVIRAELEKRLKRNRARSELLANLRSRRDGVLRPGDYWPNLALVGCWKGGTVGHYLEKFGQWLDPGSSRPVPVRDWGYLASEMRGSIPLSDEGSQGALTVASNFFEFVAPEEVSARPDEPASWSFRTVDEVEDGKEYYIIVTTPAGLYRYDINDIVQVRGYYNATPQIVFLRKGRGMTNLTGEKLSVNQVIDAIEQASRATGVTVSHFKAEADADNDRYLLRVEPSRSLPSPDAENFLREVDQFLKGINLEYKAKRDSLRLKPPVMHVMREGWYERERREHAQSGRRQFQAKTEILSPMKLATEAVRPEVERVIELHDPAAS